MVKFGVLISGGGTNLQAVIDYCQTTPKAEVAVVISNKSAAYGLTRANNYNIPNYVLNDADDILRVLKEHDVDYILLLGYLKKVPTSIIQQYPDKIINIHPSLIPAFSGKGYYGMKVHEAVIKKGVKYTGATVHFVNEIYDDGRIIGQEVVKVDEKDTPETLQQKVLEVEHQLLIQSIKEVCQI